MDLLNCKLLLHGPGFFFIRYTFFYLRKFNYVCWGWAVKNQHENKSGVGEMRMLRWICGKTKRIGLETTTLESWDHTYSRKGGVNEA